MGLDALELVLRFEEAFGVELQSDDRVADAATPRMVVDLIFSQLRMAREPVCRSQRAFYIIRTTLVQTFGLPRSLITPDMPLREHLSRSQEKQMWDEVRSALLTRDWPSLVWPRWMSRLMRVCSLMVFGVAIAAVVYLSRNAGLSANVVLLAVFAGLIMAGLFGFIADRLARPFCVCIPASIRSVRDMMPYAMTSAKLEGWTRGEVSAVVKCLVIDQLGIRESEYTEDSSFPDDFRLD